MIQLHSTPTHQSESRRKVRHFGPGLSVLAWSLLLPIAVAWKVGVQDDPTAADSGLPIKYVFEPLVTGSADRVLGAMGTLLFAAACAAILAFTVRGWFDGRWWFVMVGVAAVGIPVGWAYRVATAAYVDASIGGPIIAFLAICWTALILPFAVVGALTILEDPDPIH